MPGIPPFENILVEAPGFQITGEALKWLSRHDMGLFVMTGHNAALAMLTTPPAKRAKLRLAQHAAFCNPLPLASAIVAQKMTASHEYGFLDRRQTRAFINSAKEAADLRSLLLIEAAAAQAHFAQLRKKLVFRGLGSDWPEAWDRWDSRNASLNGPSPRNALHPFNAILNYAYMVATAQIERALSVWGFDTALGFLHALNEYRASLAYDALELLRAAIDFRILSYTAKDIRKNNRYDFPVRGLIV
jgi:CRISPR-associated protein Cas1